MAKKKRKLKNPFRSNVSSIYDYGEEHSITEFRHPEIKNKPVSALNPKQKDYIKSIKSHLVTFGVGPAGTGKTYVCGALAAEAISKKETEKIVVTRPVCEAGENLGFLPGEIEDKFAPYFQPFKDVLEERLGKCHVEGLQKAGRIETAPLAYMRGRSFKNCWVILDEAQNCTPTQMKLFLTRIGENCTVIVNGDYSQRDQKGDCGLLDAMTRLNHLPQCNVIDFEREDIVRSGLVQQIVEAYEF